MKFMAPLEKFHYLFKATIDIYGIVVKDTKDRMLTTFNVYPYSLIVLMVQVSLVLSLASDSCSQLSSLFCPAL